jgi:hypothetical protein
MVTEALVVTEALAVTETEYAPYGSVPTYVKGTVQKEKPSLVAPSQVTAGKLVEVARERQVCAQWGKQV